MDLQIRAVQLELEVAHILLVVSAEPNYRTVQNEIHHFLCL